LLAVQTSAPFRFWTIFEQVTAKMVKKNIGFSQKNEDPFFPPKKNQYFGRNKKSNGPKMECYTLLSS